MSTPAAFISYSREDSEFALRLAQDLKAAGASVWLDQIDIKPGHPWDNAIEKALEGASQMLVILTPTSSASENVKDEIAFALHEGKVVIPILYIDCKVPLRLARTQRIDFRSDYTRGLTSLLDQLRVDKPNQAIIEQAAEDEAKRNTAWQAREAEAKRLQNVMTASSSQVSAGATQQSTETHHPQIAHAHIPIGGALHPDSPYYIIQRSDLEFTECLERGDSIITIRGGHQTGKSSLLARGLRIAREDGADTVILDLQKLNSANLANAESFYKAIGAMIAVKLKVSKFLLEPDLPLSANFELYLEEQVLPTIHKRLILVIDEADRLTATTFGQEVFGMIRSWQTKRCEPENLFVILTLVIATGPLKNQFIGDQNQSSFNIGNVIRLGDFSIEQVSELNERYGKPLHVPEDLGKFYELFSGQRHLTQLGLAELKRTGSMDHLVREANTDDGPFGEHLRGILALATADTESLKAVRELLAGNSSMSTDSFFRLHQGGLLTGNYQNAQFHCNLYRSYLSLHLPEVERPTNDNAGNFTSQP